MDNTTTTTAEVANEQSANEGVKIVASVKDEKTPDIPYGRFKEKVDEVKFLNEELNKFRQAESEIEQKKLEAKGEYDKIIAEKASQVEELSAFKDKWESHEKSERAGLVAKLSDEQKARYEKLPLETLKGVVGDITKTTVETDLTQSGVPMKESDPDKMTYTEKLKYYAKRMKT